MRRRRTRNGRRRGKCETASREALRSVVPIIDAAQLELARSFRLEAAALQERNVVGEVLCHWIAVATQEKLSPGARRGVTETIAKTKMVLA